MQDFKGVVMVLVPAGCFIMGSESDRYESPTHEVCFDQPYWIDKYEVSQAQYRYLNGQAARSPFFKGDDLPVENVTWFESKSFCEIRDARLPTEAEWEYAARGPESLDYPWGTEFDGNHLNFCDSNCEYESKNELFDDGHQYIAPVGSYPIGVSWIDALDMSGNVWEWVSSLHQPYPYQPDDGREAYTGDGDIVFRGGSWEDRMENVHAAHRGGFAPINRGNFLGFRCARSFDSETSSAVPTSAPTAIAVAPTLIPAGASNTVWTPQTQDFNGVTMVLAPAGCFMMGSDSGESNEKPVHEVCLDQPFWIDRTEVTQRQFRSLGGKAANASYFTGDNRPVEQITWFEARDFCAVRGARLLTEAEWEYAARGPESLTYPWGNTFVADNVVYSGNSNTQTANVGSRPGGVSWVGVLDMSGNVWEWVSSLYWPYPYKANDGRESTSDTNSNRVLRGRGYNYDEYFLRAADRLPLALALWGGDVGFRCARAYN